MPTVRIEGIFGFDITPQSVSEQLDNLTGDLTVELFSAGGNVYDGLEVFNRIASYRGNKTVRLGGLVGSIATYVSTAFDRIVALPSSIYMIHNAMSFVIGDAQDMEAEAQILRGHTRHIANRLADRSQRSVDEMLELMDAETWLYADEIVEQGFADEMGQLQDQQQAPDNRVVAFNSAAQTLESEWKRVAQAYKMPHRHNVVTRYYENAELREEEWDSSASERRWRERAGIESNDDLPNQTYSKRFMYRDPDNEQTFSGYKLPIWDFKSGEFVNIRAVRNALSRLPQTQSIPEGERSRIQSTLQRYLTRWEEQEESNSGVAGDEQRGEATMKKEEVLQAVNTLKTNGDITLSEIAKAMGVENQVVTQDHENALALVGRFNEAGVKDIDAEFKRLKEQAEAGEQAKRENELTEAFGPREETDEKGQKIQNSVRLYAEQRYNGEATIEQIKQDPVMQTLMAQRADHTSPQNKLGVVEPAAGSGQKADDGAPQTVTY